MRREQNPNLRILELAVKRLESLADDMVFLGGCATGLLLTDVAAPPIRITQDVDVITEVASLGDYTPKRYYELTSRSVSPCYWATRNSRTPCLVIYRAMWRAKRACHWY